MKVILTLCVAVLLNVMACNASETDSKDKDLVAAFYEKALTVNTQTSPAKVLNDILASDYISVGSVESKTKEQLIGQLGFFWKLIPNLKWEIQEIIKSENQYIVRSIASGTPNGDFMGITTDGTKSFEIMTIDIHIVKNGKIQQTYHLEDWPTAMKQLKPNMVNSTSDKQSEETMKVANAFMEAMGNGDMETMVNLMHEDMVWQNEGDGSLPWIGPWEGKKVILEEFMPTFGANFKTIKWEPNDALSSGNTAAYFGNMVGLLTNTNQETKEFTYALRVKVKDGKIILWNWFEDSYEVSRAYHNK